MQLVHFNRDRVSNQIISRTKAFGSTHTLIYRGVKYELPKESSIQLICTTLESVQLLGKTLTYRGMQYAIAPAITQTTSVAQKAQRLTYRGATYVIHAA
uniref:DUF4278 domain-containing protein n=1 Tax=Oscillatoriales cyanobacterium SpSt-402 TaxID=2282168 RepID=A0A832HAV6_9CYAN